MRSLRRFLTRLFNSATRRGQDERLREEIDQHLALQTEENIRAGLSPAEARRQAVLKFGGVETVRQDAFAERGLLLLENLLQDARYSLRLLRKSPGFAVVAMATLALGIGANTAVFSVVSAVLIRELPYQSPQSLVLIWSDERNLGDTRAQLSFTDIDDYRIQNHVFENVAAFGDWSAVFADSGNPERIPGMQVGDGYFSVMGGRPVLGRVFLPEEQIEGKDRVIILGYGLWQRRFAADPDVIGRQVRISGRSYTVVGVMPKDFAMLPSSLVTGGAQFYRPVAEEHSDKERNSRHLRAVARLRPGVTLQQAQADLNVINRQMAQQFPVAYAATGVRVVKLQDDTVGNLRQSLEVLLGAVGFLLLIACANIANLLLARSLGRRNEIATRSALGASHGRLARQALTESVMLASGGGILGVALAYWGTKAISALGAKVIPQLVDVGIDPRVLGFTAATSLLTGMLFGIIPALQLRGLDVIEVLKQAGRDSRGTGHGTFRKALAISEFALSAALLVGAGLMLRTYGKLRGVDPGFNPNHLLTMSIGLPSSKYPFATEKPVAFYGELLNRIIALPGVQSAGAVHVLPLGNDFDTVRARIEGQAYSPGTEPFPERYIVTPGYFRAMQIALVNGRSFSQADDAKAPLVVMISETAAQRWWPGQDAIGKRVRVSGNSLAQSELWRTVVGVVKDVKQNGLDAPHTMQVYVPHAQFMGGSMVLVARTASDPLNYIMEVRQQVSALDKELAVSDIASMEQVVSGSIAARRFSTVLLGAFAGLGLLLASIGVYGVVSYSVAQRTREMGIRIALGATRANVLALVVGQGLRLFLLGMAAGSLATFGLTRFMSGILFGISAADPSTFVCVALLLGAVAFLASYIPARRVARVDPMVALRCE
jgi:putative ABC transport system permease protein